MPALLVASLAPHAGKTGITAAVTQRIAYQGQRVLALRLGAAGDAHAAADAAYFATLPGARGRGGEPVPPVSATQDVPSLAGDSVAIVEAPEGGDLAALARDLAAPALLVHHGSPDDDAILALQDAALDLGERLLGVVLVAVPAAQIDDATAAIDAAALPLLGALPEDRLLYAPTIGEIAEFLQGDLILGEDDAGLVIEELMIGPILSDPGQAYFARRGNKAIVTRSDKTDSTLAALASNTDCLILTGGLIPSPYTLDRAANEEVAVILARATTPQTVRRLEDIFATTRFGSERKLERISELLAQRLDWPPIAAALGLQPAPAR